MSGTKKSSKKLASFLKDKNSSAKKFKAFSGYLEAVLDEGGSGGVEEAETFRVHSEVIFSVFHDKWTELETAAKKGTKTHQVELVQALSLLRKVLEHLQDLVRTRWKHDRIGNVILQCLWPHNRHATRLQAWELLLLFIQANRTPSNEQIDAQISQFAWAVNLKPFVQQYSIPQRSVTLRHPPPENKEEAISPATAEATTADAIEMLDLFLEFAAKKETDFTFWLSLFKEFYLSAFYPRIMRDSGVVSKTDETGFSRCPYEVQKVLIDRFSKWAERSSISKMVWEERSADIMLEIFGQAVSMPIQYQETAKKAYDIYKDWLGDFAKSSWFGEKLQDYWRTFLKNALLVFEVPSSGEESTSHQALCSKALTIIYTFSIDLSQKMDTNTWHSLQLSILETTTKFVARLDSNPQNKTILPVADSLFQALYFVWIKSAETTKDMWSNLQGKLKGMTHWKSAVLMWKEKIIQLTFILKDFIYNGNELELLAGPKKVKHVSTLISRDTKLDTSINWDEDRITETWFIFLDILGNLNKIPEPVTYEIALSCTKETIELLIQAEEEMLQYDEEPPIPLFGVFLPVLLESCGCDHRLFKGTLIAYSTLCLLFCRQHAKPLDLKLLSHFYRALHLGLGSGKEVIIWQILSSARNIFSLDLPGVHVLIPDFLREIDRLFNSALLENIPQEIERDSLTISNSLICFSNHYKQLDIPGLNFGNEQKITCGEVHAQVAHILSAAMNRENPSVRQYCLWGICVMISQDLLSTTPRRDIVNNLVNDTLHSCLNQNAEISQTALDSLSTIAQLYEPLSKLDQSIITMIINQLCDNIIGILTKAKIVTNDPLISETIVSNHFYCLIEWFMAGKSANALGNSQLASKASQAISVGLFGELDVKSEDKDKGQDLKKEKRLTKSPSALKASTESYFSQLRTKPSHGSEVVKEAAETTLLYMMNFYNNFPTSAGPEQVSSDVSEDSESKQLFFIYDDSVILSLTEFTDPQKGPMARFVSRTAVGKHCWDSKIQYESVKGTKAKQTVTLDSSSIGPSKAASSASPLPSYSRQAKELPVFSEQVNAEQIDMVNELLHFLAESHPECLPPSSKVSSFFQPLRPSPNYNPDIEKISASLDNQDQVEKEKIAETLASQRKLLPLLPPFHPSNSSFHYPRLLLSHLGFLTLENMKYLHLAEDNVRFRRSLKDLDRIQGRQVLKAGVVFVAEGQEDQRAIFSNDSGSKEYNAFLKGLGWSADLATHAGFMGGLDGNGSNGKTAPYWANASYEVIFHCNTRIPTVEADPQQIQKKRHIGNDIVHVIWSEHKRDYNPLTITSQFNDAHVIIYPLSSGMFRVQTYRKEKVSFFGPLLDEMVISKRLLPFLVRQTVINANRNVRYSTKGYKRPFTAREEFIKETVKRYKTDLSFDDYMMTLFPLKGDDSWRQQLQQEQLDPQAEDVPVESPSTPRLAAPAQGVSQAPVQPQFNSATSEADKRLREEEERKRMEEKKKEEERYALESKKLEEENKKEENKKEDKKDDTDKKKKKSFSFFGKKKDKKDKDDDKPSPSPDQEPGSPVVTRALPPSTVQQPPVQPTPVVQHTTPTPTPVTAAPPASDPSKAFPPGRPTSPPPRPMSPERPTSPPVRPPMPGARLLPTVGAQGEGQPAPLRPTPARTGPGSPQPVRPLPARSTPPPMGSVAPPMSSTAPLSSNPPVRGNPPPTRGAPAPVRTAVGGPAPMSGAPPPMRGGSPMPGMMPTKATTTPTHAPTASSAPSSTHGNTIPFEELKGKIGSEGLDSNKLEIYLSDDDFQKVLGMSRSAFNAMPLWKQNNKKRQVGLF